MSTLEEKQADLADIKNQVTELLKSLENAEGCENETDFTANLDDAFDQIAAIKRELKQKSFRRKRNHPV